MKKIATLIFLLTTCIQFANSQQTKFSKIYYDISAAKANAMAKTYDGGLILCGNEESQLSVLRVDSLGDVLWAKKIGFTYDGTFNSLVRTTDSCFVLVGKIYNSLLWSYDIVIVKIDLSGAIIWTKVIEENDSQEAMSIEETYDGGFIVTGYEFISLIPNSHILVLKLDSQANVEWYNVLSGGNTANIGSIVKQLPDSSFVVGGGVEDSSIFDGKGYICNFSRTGVLQWTNFYNTSTPQNFTINDLVIDSNGVFVYGSSESGSLFIFKIGFNGSLIWSKEIGNGIGRSNCINCLTDKMRLLANGQLVFVAGSTSSSWFSFLVNIDTSGTFNWAQFLENSVYDVLEADDHGLFLLGSGPMLGVRTTTISQPHFGINKTDSLGNADICTSPYPPIILNSNVVTVNAVTMTNAPRIISSIVKVPVESAILFSTQNSCVDFIGAIDENGFLPLEFYPNPSTSSVILKLKDVTGNVQVKVTDIFGQIVLEKQVDVSNENEIRFDHHLSSGVYSVVAISSEKKFVGKMIVE